MPVYCCSAYCIKIGERYGYLSTGIAFAISREEAIGLTLCKIKKLYPAIKGWQHEVTAGEIPTGWIKEMVGYEDRINQERKNVKEKMSTCKQKKRTRNRATIIKVSSPVEQK